MRSLIQPTRNAKEVLALCAKHVRGKSYAKRLNSVANTIGDAETEYKTKAEASQLFTIQPASSVANNVTVEEMVRLYANTLSGIKSPIRYLYDDLKAAPRNGICPLCGQRVVSTLDHYLAKSLHPALAITPVNLIPACSDCNKTKGNMQPASAAEQTLHPYFDQTDDDVWLKANVVEVKPPALEFLPFPPDGWPELKRQRIINHFRVFKLAQLYASYAAEELLSISVWLSRIGQNEGMSGIQAYLVEIAEGSRTISRNSWRVAMYEGLRESDWFCAEGYRSIA